MLKFSEDALALVGEKNSPLFIDLPRTISNCCFEITECPAVNFGEPRQLDQYTRKTIQGAVVYVPSCIPDSAPLVIRIRNLFGFKRLVIDGWGIV